MSDSLIEPLERHLRELAADHEGMILPVELRAALVFLDEARWRIAELEKELDALRATHS